MSSFTRPALLDGTRAVGLSLVLGIVLAFMPLMAPAAVPLLPIPVAFVTSRHGIVAGLLASIITGAAALALTGVAAGLLIFMLVALTGLGAGLFLKLGFPQLRFFLAVAALFCIALVAWLAVMLVIAGVGPVTAMEQVTDSAIEPAREFYMSLGMSQEDVDGFIADARDMATALPYVAPALLLVASILFSGTTVAVARRVFARLRQPFPTDFTFRELGVHWAFAYGMILGLVCEFGAPLIPEPYGSGVDLVGANLLIVSEVVFFIQGMAIASFFIWHYRLTKFKKAGLYTCLVLLQVTLSLISWLGLFDIWIDYRRRFIRPKRT